MTSTVGTPILSRHAPSQEEPGTKRQPVPNTGEFASLIHQAVLKPQTRARGAIDRPPRAVIPAAKARNLGTGNAPKMSAPAKEEDSAAAPIPSWPAGFVAPVSSQPVAVPEPAIEDSGSERASSDSTDVGLPLIPAPAAEQKEHGSPSIDKPEVLGAPAQAGKSDVDFAFTPARSTPTASTSTSPIRYEMGMGRKEDGSPRIKSPEVRVVSQDGSGNAYEEEPAKTDSHRQDPGACRTEPDPRGTESTPASDLPEQLSLASAPQPVSPDQPSPPPRVATLEPVPDSLPSASGMWPALHRNTMQTTHEVDENAGQAEQNLPALEAAPDSSRPTEQDRGASAAITDRIPTVPAAATEEAAVMMVNHPVGHDFVAHTETGSTQPTLAQAVGRVIENTVVGLQHASATSLAVVLKPDGNTQLSLQLKLQHGHFEAFAVLERGDFKSLTSEWAQLQGRLADQGIRLAPLVSNLPRTSGFAGGQFSSPKQQRDDASSVDAPGPNIASLTARKSGAPTVPSTTGREWWA